MTSKLTREENVQAVFDLKAGYTLGLADVEILKRVARMALAAMDSEPVAEVVSVFGDSEIIGERELKLLVGIQNMPYGTKFYRHAQPAKGLELAGWQFKSVNGDWLGLIDEHGKNQAVREGCEVREVFAMADGVNDRDQVRSEHAEWSQATFGNVGPVGPLKHLSKEALEAAAEPDDLSEWADLQFLLWDAQRRAGITDEQITLAMIEKLAVNKQREWPEPKDGEPRLHIKAQPAPVAYSDFEEFWSAYIHPLAQDDELKGFAWDIWCAAMLQERQKSAGVSNNCRSNENVQVMQDVSRCSTKAAPVLDSLPKTAESRCSKSPMWIGVDWAKGFEPGNSPVIPDGYVMVPKEPTDEMLAASYMFAHVDATRESWLAMLAAAPQEVQGE